MKTFFMVLLALMICFIGCRNEISYYKRGVYHETKGEYAKSLQAYRNSIKHDSTYALSYFGIGRVMVKNTRWEDALNYLLKSSDLGIDDQDLYMMLGQVYESLDEIELAAEAYGKAIKARPDDALSHLILGASLEKDHQYEAALNEYNSAIVIAIDFPEAYFHSARMLAKLDRFKEAEETYLQVIKLNNKYVQAQNNLTVIYLNTRQPIKAFESAKKTQKIDAGYIPGIVNMGVAYEMLGDKKKAEECYIKAIKRDETSSLAHFRLAMFMLSNDNIDKTRDELKLALQYNPEFSQAYNEMGLLALEDGKYKEALEHLQRAVSIDSTYASAYYNMGGVLANMGEYQKAAEAYNNYLTHNKTSEDSSEVAAKIRILLSADKY